MRVWSHDRFTFPLPGGHRFPLGKYRLLRERVVAEGLVARGDVREPGPVGWAELELVHERALLERSLVNDVAVAATLLRRDGLAGRVLVVDCDVHQGDGTAQIFATEPEVFTLSLHGARNYPFTRIPSDLDVDLPSGTGDGEYLAALDDALGIGLERSRAELAFYLAGADPWQGDRLGRLALTKAGLRARDELVLDRLLAAGVVVAVVLAGGYADDVRDTVDINMATVAVAGERMRAPRPL